MWRTSGPQILIFDKRTQRNRGYVSSAYLQKLGRGVLGGVCLEGIQGITRGFRPPCVTTAGLRGAVLDGYVVCILSRGGRRILTCVTRIGFGKEDGRGLFLTAKNQRKSSALTAYPTPFPFSILRLAHSLAPTTCAPHIPSVPSPQTVEPPVPHPFSLVIPSTH